MSDESARRVTRYLAAFSKSIAQLPGATELHRPNYSAVFSHRAMFNRFYDREWPSRITPADIRSGSQLAREANVRPVWIVDHTALSPDLHAAFAAEGFTTQSEWIGMEHDLENAEPPAAIEGVSVEAVQSLAALRIWTGICADPENYKEEQSAVFFDLFAQLGWTTSGSTHLIAAAGARAAATASLLKIGDLAAIDWVHTLPEARGKGIASHLVALLLSEARARGCRHVVLTSTTMAESLYRRQGFEECSRVSAFRLASPRGAVSS